MRGASFPQSGAVPENGQITKIEVRGYYVEGCENKEEEGHFCERHIHFQDLRKLPNGELEVISTTQAFTLPKKEEHGENKHTYEPTNFFVQKGDYIGLATVGGKFEVLASAPGATTDVFAKHNGDMNGSHLTATQKSGAELNMRMTLQPTG